MDMVMVSCQKGPTCHAYAWQIGPFWQDTHELVEVLHTFNYSYDKKTATNTNWVK